MNLQHKSSRRWLGATLALCMIPGIGHGMQFSVVSVDPNDSRHIKNAFLLMKGEIVPGDYDRLITFSIRSHVDLTRKLVILSSPGGDVTEALKLGQLVKSLYLSVSVGSFYGPCVSACFIVYASAVERTSQPGLIGIHRPYLNPERVRSLSPADAEALETRALTDAEAYLHKLRVPNGLVDVMFQNSSGEIHWLTFDELETQIGRRATWYEEFSIARCGLDKGAELNYLTDTNYDYLYPQLELVWTCGLKLTHPVAVRNFAKALAPYTYGFSDENGFFRLPPPDPTPELLARCNANPKSCEMPDSFFKRSGSPK